MPPVNVREFAQRFKKYRLPLTVTEDREMTPAARIAAAIELLDRILAPEPVERALSNWGRRNRYAGSKDRAALRDLVFDALRCRRSFAALGGAETGRGLMIGALRAQGHDVDEFFSGARYAPATLTEDESAAGAPPAAEGVVLDCPDWLLPYLRSSLGSDADSVLQALRQRAPVFLRVNSRKASRETAMAALSDDGITTMPHPLSLSALQVVDGARRIRASQVFTSGVVELQDAASQAASDLVPLSDGARMLDLCAGGGGKTLAVAGRVRGRFWAHDINPARMTDLPERATRAGVDVACITTDDLASASPFDLVLVDAPCSGSGSWRRDPQGKWALTPERLSELCEIQADLLRRAAGYLRPGGELIYMTCSLLDEENGHQVERFMNAHAGWTHRCARKFTPLDGGDGFYFSRLTR